MNEHEQQGVDAFFVQPGKGQTDLTVFSPSSCDVIPLQVPLSQGQLGCYLVPTSNQNDFNEGLNASD